MTIPENAMQSAYAAIDAYHNEEDGPFLAEYIARAILAERRRCADVARKYQEDLAGCSPNDDEPEKIYAAVMAGT